MRTRAVLAKMASSSHAEDGRHMRGHEQHVERKIRLWVVAQEHNRLRDAESARIDTPTDERPESGGRTDLDARSHEAWRLDY
jgi:hypothetical protein